MVVAVAVDAVCFSLLSAPVPLVVAPTKLGPDSDLIRASPLPTEPRRPRESKPDEPSWSGPSVSSCLAASVDPLDPPAKRNFGLNLRLSADNWRFMLAGVTAYSSLPDVTWMNWAIQSRNSLSLIRWSPVVIVYDYGYTLVSLILNDVYIDSSSSIETLKTFLFLGHTKERNHSKVTINSHPLL